jgi:hypothetical protein
VFQTSVEGVNKLVADLGKRGALVGPRYSQVEVGYASPYALAVHENRQMKLRGVPRPSGIGRYWDAESGPGRAGFLLDVGREMADELREKVRSQVRRGIQLSDAILEAGRLLLRRSMTQVPYEFGELKKSGFVQLTEET